MSDLLDAVKDAVTKWSEVKTAEERIKEITGMDISVEIEDCPSSWEDWMKKTGCNSLCTDDSWRFLDDNQWNQRKIELWKERSIDKIVMKVKEDVESEDRWVSCMPEWEEGSKTLVLVWYPRAGNWSSSNAWGESGSKTWWNLADEITFGLRLYQLPGKCFYKSDWLEDFEDVDPDGMLPTSTHKVKRWFQFRHWIIYWYPTAMWGYNWAYTKQPPKLPDGSDFSLDSVLKCPSLPDFTMPEVKLPSLPDVELPSVDMPSVDLPSIEAPSIGTPSIGTPSLGSMPSMPEKKVRPSGKWAAHGFIELTDMKVKADGKDIIFSNCHVTDFWEKDGHIDTEKKDNARYVLKCTDDEQAKSWEDSLAECGVEVGDTGGCCTVA